MGDAEFLRERAARRIGVHADDHIRAGKAGALNDVQSYAAQAEHDDIGSGFHFRRVDDGADSGAM